QQLELHRPGAATAERARRPLNQGQPRYRVAAKLESLLHHRHSRTEDELPAPVVQPAALGDGAQQVAPGGVAVGVLAEESPDAGAEALWTHEVVQLLEHRRRLVVDDRAVVALGLV